MRKPRVLSGIQPSGNLHIGNYLGAIKQFVALQNSHEAFYCIVDEHAITVPQKPEELRENTIALATAYLAAGIDPKRSVIFVQSHVPAHTELGWILNTMTPLGELERMTQFKDKAKEQRGEVFAGLFSYPTLMAADILLYHANVVPVGEDQTQHIELTRSLAKRFNNKYGETFTVPEFMLRKETSRVMALDDPTKKMSKSAASESSYVALLDPPDVIRKKIKSAVTDSGKEIIYDSKNKPGIANLLAIASAFSGKAISEFEKEFSGSTYAAFKDAVAEHVVAGLESFQRTYQSLEKNPAAVTDILRDGAERANAVANQTLQAVKEKMGFLTRTAA